MVDIIINEDFSEGVDSLFTEGSPMNFDSQETFDLRRSAEEISNDNEINELRSYGLIKGNLAYDLPHQYDGALKLLRDHNATALLADEVGLGKTITTGMLIKEGIVRGFLKKIVILTPPSLVDQWVAELKEKFNIDFNIIESPADWGRYDFSIASIDRVKIFDKVQRKFRHSGAHAVSWDLVIVDEAHKLKEKSTVRWRFVDRLKKKRFL